MTETTRAGSREAEELSPEQVIAWLASPEGERWRAAFVGRLTRHNAHSGIFGELIPDVAGCHGSARWTPPRWPVPGGGHAH